MPKNRLFQQSPTHSDGLCVRCPEAGKLSRGKSRITAGFDAVENPLDAVIFILTVELIITISVTVIYHMFEIGHRERSVAVHVKINNVLIGCLLNSRIRHEDSR